MQAGASGGLYIIIIYNPCNRQDQQLVVFNMECCTLCIQRLDRVMSSVNVFSFDSFIASMIKNQKSNNMIY